MGVTLTMKTLFMTHAQFIFRTGGGWDDTYSVETMIDQLSRVAAYDADVPLTVRMRNANNTITVVFAADTGCNWGFLMRGAEYFDCVVDAVRFKEQLTELFDCDSHQHYTFYLPAELPHFYSSYRRYRN